MGGAAAAPCLPRASLAPLRPAAVPQAFPPPAPLRPRAQEPPLEPYARGPAARKAPRPGER
eukprot:12933135-Alexandrium_andersonii.AAC.1